VVDSGSLLDLIVVVLEDVVEGQRLLWCPRHDDGGSKVIRSRTIGIEEAVSDRQDNGGVKKKRIRKLRKKEEGGRVERLTSVEGQASYY
jgi:hypothetical protein